MATIPSGTAGLLAAVALAAAASLLLLGVRLARAQRLARECLALLAASQAGFLRLADTDPLTGLGNRGLLRRALERLPDRDSATLLAVDLDGFKDINDGYGHLAGDAVLVTVAERIQAHIRPVDLAVRLDGDEFAILVDATPVQARHVAQRLLRVLDRPCAPGIPGLVASIGLAGCGTAPDVDGVLRNADQALRAAKQRAGPQRARGRVAVFDPGHDLRLRRRQAVARELRGALERDELTVLYQPVVALPSGRTVGVEALVRWTHPTLGQLSPAEFLPVAEETGLIVELGYRVRHLACRQLSQWLADGHELWMAVNVSVHELRAPEFAVQVLSALRAHCVPPPLLMLELTEHQAAQDVTEVAGALRTLRGAGVRIALDDFGAGYSSLGQLSRLAVDVLKIDRALVGGYPAGADAPLVDMVVGLGHRLGLQVIAEGVEEPDQRRLVERARCHLGQGYLFGRPMLAEQVGALLAGVTEVVAGGTAGRCELPGIGDRTS